MKQLIITIITILSISYINGAEHKHGKHGFVVFGDNLQYASHLPLLNHPHDVQLVIEISFEKAQQISGLENKLYTFLPHKSVDLNQFSKSGIKIAGNLYDGHFEKDGQVLFEINIQVNDVMVNEPIKGVKKSGFSEYYIFGNLGKYFLLTKIYKKSNDFNLQKDQIVELKSYKILKEFSTRLGPEEILLNINFKVKNSIIESKSNTLKGLFLLKASQLEYLKTIFEDNVF